MNRPLLCLALAALLDLAPSLAAANSGGITSASGKQGAICTVCHSGGAVPEVRLEQLDPTGPIPPGALATFRVVVRSAAPGTQTAAGFNAAASAGTLAILAGEGSRATLQELTHTAPKDNDSEGLASWRFTWTAPATPGSYTLFAAGNSVNENRAASGDNANKTTLVVEVAAPAPTATATATDVPATATPTLTNTPEPTPTEPPPPSPSPTSTVPASPTPTTVTAPACTGDCDGNGEVTVDEIVKGLNIALGNLPLESCPAFDRNGDIGVTVEELVEAIRRALDGCPLF